MNCSEPANRETLAKGRVLKYCPNSWSKHFIQFYQKLLILPLVHSQVPVPEKKALKPFLAKFLVHTIPNPLKKMTADQGYVKEYNAGENILKCG